MKSNIKPCCGYIFLHQALARSSELKPGDQEKAKALCDSLQAWTMSLGNRYSSYRDLVQPLQSAAMEMHYGLSSLCVRCDLEQSLSFGLTKQLSTLMAYPTPASCPLTNNALEELLTSLHAGDPRSSDESRIHMLRLRLELLLVTLEGSARWLKAVTQAGGDMTRESCWVEIHAIFEMLVKVWNDVEVEAQRLEEEKAALFKMKTKDVKMSIDDRVGT